MRVVLVLYECRLGVKCLGWETVKPETTQCRPTQQNNMVITIGPLLGPTKIHFHWVWSPTEGPPINEILCVFGLKPCLGGCSRNFHKGPTTLGFRVGCGLLCDDDVVVAIIVMIFQLYFLLLLFRVLSLLWRLL